MKCKLIAAPIATVVMLCACDPTLAPPVSECPTQATIDYLKQQGILSQTPLGQWQASQQQLTFYGARFQLDSGQKEDQQAKRCWQELSDQFGPAGDGLWQLNP